MHSGLTGLCSSVEMQGWSVIPKETSAFCPFPASPSWQDTSASPEAVIQTDLWTGQISKGGSQLTWAVGEAVKPS